MQIKRFEAKNMTTALRMIKDELGSEAVILSARSLRKGKGFFGSMKYAGVVVSAAIDNQRPPIKNTNSSDAENTSPNFKKTRFVGVDQTRNKRRRLSSVYPDTSRLYRQQRNRIEEHGTNDSKNPFTALYQQILAQEVDRGIAAKLIEEIKRIPGS
ncbi:MAG: hypothetical protein KJO34_06065, partial [Deltaproteobacteria bacterium]|nr:hypothetical protein [Deltaproteobacteria bacterium]